jgi:flagellar biosynthesis/type III secretory pathway ATPase
MPDVTTLEHRAKAAAVRDWLATLRDNEDLVSVGAYVPGSNPRIDAALARREAIGRFLCQPADMAGRLTDAITALHAL